MIQYIIYFICKLLFKYIQGTIRKGGRYVPGIKHDFNYQQTAFTYVF